MLASQMHEDSAGVTIGMGCSATLLAGQMDEDYIWVSPAE